jgi:magnesium chelatase family protein
MDRIDMHVALESVPPEELAKRPQGETSKAVRERVLGAREHQRKRSRHEGPPVVNADMNNEQLLRWANLGPEESLHLVRAARALGLTARSWNRVIKVARTIADLDGADEVSTTHLSEALSYRLLDRRGTSASGRR